MKYAVIELKHDEGKHFIVPTSWILNFTEKYSLTDSFLCYLSTNLEETPNFECGYSTKFNGVPSLFMAFIVKLAGSIEEAEGYLKGKRVKAVPKRFRDAGNTDTEIKSIQAKKKRSVKKELKAHKAQAEAKNMEYLIDNVQLHPPSTTSASLNEHNITFDEKQNIRRDKNITDIPSQTSLTDLHVESSELMQSASYEQLVHDFVNDGFQLQLGPNIDEQLENTEPDVPPIASYNISEVLKPMEDYTTNRFNACNNEQNNIIILNFDDLTKTNNDQAVEINHLKAEVDDLKLQNNDYKLELENANKRNLLLQNYLLAADERVPETLFIEKDGGRFYRGGVFLNKIQCSVLDKAKSDREFINNLAVAIFGREVLKTSSVTGAPSNKTKGPPKLKLNEELLQLIYDIMDARSCVNKTKKLSKPEKNAIIGKKCSNLAACKSSDENQNLQ